MGTQKQIQMKKGHIDLVSILGQTHFGSIYGPFFFVFMHFHVNRSSLFCPRRLWGQASLLFIVQLPSYLEAGCLMEADYHYATIFQLISESQLSLHNDVF